MSADCRQCGADFLMIRRPPRSTRKESSAASDVYKRQLKSSSGVYYYKCVVDEIKIDGIQQKTINGFIQIVN